MSTPKFKVGDRVVYIHHHAFPLGGIYYVTFGSKGIIRNIISPTNHLISEYQIEVTFDKGGDCSGLFEWKFILEEIWDSPLYKALKED